ncbi:MAG: hypothetical protein FJ319_04500 [SAR202 cluster bacterium]|nr:hypothetical protein [SAR202 cluster bacterium]
MGRAREPRGGGFNRVGGSRHVLCTATRETSLLRAPGLGEISRSPGRAIGAAGGKVPCGQRDEAEGEEDVPGRGECGERGEGHGERGDGGGEREQAVWSAAPAAPQYRAAHYGGRKQRHHILLHSAPVMSLP